MTTDILKRLATMVIIFCVSSSSSVEIDHDGGVLSVCSAAFAENEPLDADDSESELIES